MNRSLRVVLRWFRTGRAWCAQFVDQPVRQLRLAVGRLNQGRVDVLFLGNSTNLFVEPFIPRRPCLDELIDGELGTGVTTARLTGPGYGVTLQAEFIRLLTALEQRPRVVVVAMAVRTTAVHVARHPQYGYRRSIEFLRTLNDPRGRLPFISRRNRRTEADFERFHALEVTTRWGCGRTIGEFQSALRGRRDAAEDLGRQRRLFDYLHGEFLASDNGRLEPYVGLGRRLRDYGVPVVTYWEPIPIERGETYFPGEFAAHVRANVKAAKSAFEEALGPLLHAVDPGETPDDEILDSRDGSEHWNLKGRRRMAVLITEQVRAAHPQLADNRRKV